MSDPTIAIGETAVPAWVGARGSLDEHRQHRHSLDDIVAYVVRTAALPADSVDLAYFGQPDRYAAALEFARTAHRVSGDLHVVDCVYGCGCRS